MAISVHQFEIIEEPVVNTTVNHFLDITSEVCPLTFVRTKLVIEKMKPGDTLEVRLRGIEPLRNVPRSVVELGHTVLSLTPEEGENEAGIHQLSYVKSLNSASAIATGLPQHIGRAVIVHAPRQYEQMVGQSIEIGQSERIDRFGFRYAR